MYPRRAHCPTVVPDTPTSSPTSPASSRPWTPDTPLGYVAESLQLALHRQPLERLGLHPADLRGRHADALGGLAQRGRPRRAAVDAVAQPHDALLDVGQALDRAAQRLLGEADRDLLLRPRALRGQQ